MVKAKFCSVRTSVYSLRTSVLVIGQVFFLA